MTASAQAESGRETVYHYLPKNARPVTMSHQRSPCLAVSLLPQRTGLCCAGARQMPSGRRVTSMRVDGSRLHRDVLTVAATLVMAATAAWMPAAPAAA